MHSLERKLAEAESLVSDQKLKKLKYEVIESVCNPASRPSI